LAREGRSDDALEEAVSGDDDIKCASARSDPGAPDWTIEASETSASELLAASEATAQGESLDIKDVMSEVP
jgi:hypothetical protein